MLRPWRRDSTPPQWAYGSPATELRRPHNRRNDGSGGWIRTNDLRVMSPTSCHCSTPRCIVSIQIYLPLGKARARATPCIFYNPTYTHLRAPAISLSPDRCCRVAKLHRLHHAPPDNIPRTHAHPLLHSWRNGYPAKAHSLEKADRRSGSPRPGRDENVKDIQGRVRPLHDSA